MFPFSHRFFHRFDRQKVRLYSSCLCCLRLPLEFCSGEAAITQPGGQQKFLRQPPKEVSFAVAYLHAGRGFAFLPCSASSALRVVERGRVVWHCARQKRTQEWRVTQSHCATNGASDSKNRGLECGVRSAELSVQARSMD